MLAMLLGVVVPVVLSVLSGTTATDAGTYDVQRVQRAGFANQSLCGKDFIASPAGQKLPALNPTCSQGAGIVEWQDGHASSAYNILTVFHSNHGRGCHSRRFRVNRPQGSQAMVRLDLSLVMNRYSIFMCQNLQTSSIAVQRCNKNGVCGLVNKCLTADYCNPDFAAPRVHGHARTGSASFRLNLYLTPWSNAGDDQNLVHVLQRAVGGQNTAACTLRRVCKPRKKRCFLTCKKLHACTKYEFCPYIHNGHGAPGYFRDGAYNRSRCSHGNRNWLDVTTNYSREQRDSVAKMKLRTWRLNEANAFASLEGDWPVGGLTIQISICLKPVNNPQRIGLCINKSIGDAENERHILIGGLGQDVSYETVARACLTCASTTCLDLAAGQILPANQWPVGVNQLQIGRSGKFTPAFALSWSPSFTMCGAKSKLCTLKAEVQCDHQAPSKLPLQHNQSELLVPWDSMVRQGQPLVQCSVWMVASLSIPVSGGLPIMVRISPITIEFFTTGSLPTVETLRSPGSVGGQYPPIDGPKHDEGSSPSTHDTSVIVALTLSSAFAVGTLVIILAVVQKCRKRRAAAREQGDHATLVLASSEDNTAAAATPDSGRACADSAHQSDHTYEKLRTVRHSVRNPQAGRASVKVMCDGSITLAPPLPCGPRPVHILTNPMAAGNTIQTMPGHYTRLSNA